MKNFQLIETLQEMGLTKNESEVYLSLLRKKGITIYEIAKDVDIARTNIYDILTRLTEKGLASYVIKKNKKYIYPTDPNRLDSILKYKQSLLKNTMPTLEKLYLSNPKKPVIEVYEGIGGWKSLMTEMLKIRKDVWIFNAIDIDILKKEGIKNYYLKRIYFLKKQLGIKTYILYVNGINPPKGPKYKLKKLPKEYEYIPVSYWVYGDRLAIGTWKHPFVITRIIDENISKAYKKGIKTIWRKI